MYNAGQAASYKGIGDIHLKQKLYDVALHYYDQVLPFYDRANSSINQANTLAAQSIALLMKGEGRASEVLKAALAIRVDRGDNIGIANDTCAYGKALIELGDSSGALDYLNQALDYYRRLNEVDSASKVEVLIARCSFTA